MPSSPQFIRFFTQKTGASPLKYREAYRKNSFTEQEPFFPSSINGFQNPVTE